MEREPEDPRTLPDADWPLTGQLERFDRRVFVAGLSAAAAGLVLGGLPRVRAEASPDAPSAKTFSPEEWRSMAAAVDRLLPSGPDSPGARDVNAVGYLDAVLAHADVDPAEASLVKDGAARLGTRARARGAASYADLPPDAQDAALRAFEGSDGGRAWLTVVLGYVLEAFLADPVHGGNPGEIGWKWAGVEPGSPRLGPDGKPYAASTANK